MNLTENEIIKKYITKNHIYYKLEITNENEFLVEGLDDYVEKNKLDKFAINHFVISVILPSLRETDLLLKRYIKYFNINESYYCTFNQYAINAMYSAHQYINPKKAKFINFVLYTGVCDIISGNSQRLDKAKYKNETIEFLLKNGLNPNTILVSNLSLLQYAIYDLNLELATLLLRYGADPNLESDNSDNLVDFVFNFMGKHSCFSKELENIVNYIFNIPNLKWDLTNNMLKNNQQLILKYDLLSKRDSNNSISPIILKNTVYSCNAEIIEYFLKTYGNHIFGSYAIHKLAEEGCQHKIKILVDYGYNINEINNEGDTCLIHYLSSCYKKNGSISINFIKYLVESGCDIHIINKKGYNALYYLHTGYKDTIEVLEYFISKGINININDGELLAIWKNSAKSRVLLNSGIIITAKNKECADLMQVDNLMNGVNISQNVKLININKTHIKYFIKKFKLVELELSHLGQMQHFILSKEYNIYHKYWKNCAIFSTYNITCANWLYKISDLIYNDMDYLKEFTSFIEDSAILWGIFIAKVEKDPLIKSLKWINTNKIEDRSIINIDSINDKIVANDSNISKEDINEDLNITTYNICGKRTRGFEENDDYSLCHKITKTIPIDMDMGMCFI